jgi:hypothetical protein
MPVTKEQAIRLAIEHLMKGIEAADVIEGWPGSFYGATDEPVWSLRVPEPGHRVGGTHYIVISQVTGQVLADASFGE